MRAFDAPRFSGDDCGFRKTSLVQVRGSFSNPACQFSITVMLERPIPPTGTATEALQVARSINTKWNSL
jgi:hypothetical protein